MSKTETVASDDLAPLPAVFDSQQQAAAATGIPIEALKRSKRAGCPAFKSNRIYLRPLLVWIFAKPDTAKAETWKAVDEEYTARLKQHNYERKTERVVERGEAIECIRAGMATVFSELDRLFLNELPPALKGLDEIQIRQRAQAEIERLRVTLKDKFTLTNKEDAK